MQLIIASHGEMALGVHKTLSMLVGERDNIHAICAYVKGCSFNEECQRILDKYPDEVICIACDLTGGSVFQNACRFANERIHVLGSINLVLLMELVMKNNVDVQECHHMLEQAKEHMQLFEKKEINEELFF